MMRICRYRHQRRVGVGFYDEQAILPLPSVAAAYNALAQEPLKLPASKSLLTFLPPRGSSFSTAKRLSAWLAENPDHAAGVERLATADVELLVPIPEPAKIFLLAGNYARHIEEGGGIAAERTETFPYVFMKPPTTTLTDPGKPVRIPGVSPHYVDWELELAVIIGRRAKSVAAADALRYVAGYTVLNDISDRRFQPNPQRKPRPKDAFFDWLHGKWHDGFCPCGPCVASADAVPDPQNLQLELRLNGEIRQSASTAQQIFPVGAVIEFISSFVTLEPGDIISTGTPQGVGDSTGTYLKPGDRLEATIGAIGSLVTPIVGAD